MSTLEITVTYSVASVEVSGGSGPVVQITQPPQTQILQLGSISGAANQQITQAVASTTASAATATAAAATATSEAGVATAAAGTATAEAEAAAASATASANAYSAIANGTATSAGTLTGAEIIPLSRGAGLLQTTLTAIANFVSSFYKNLIGVMDVNDFAAGGTDDTVQITNAFNWLAGASRRCLRFQSQHVYTVSATTWLSGVSYGRIEGRGATIQAAATLAVAANTELVALTNVTDTDIFDLNLDGNRSARNPSGTETYAHNLVITTGCARVRVWRSRSDNAVSDGFYINTTTQTVLSSLPTDIDFYACRANNAYRNGLSVINSNRFRDHFGIYTGSTGTAPMVGVDCEPNMVTGDLGNIGTKFYGTVCSTNSGGGLQVAQSANDATLIGCDLSSNTGYGLVGYMSTVKVCGGTVFDGNTQGAIGGTFAYLTADGIIVQNHGTTTVNGVINVLTGTIEAHISNVDSRNNNTASASLPLINVQSAGTGFIGVSIDSVTHANSSCSILNTSARVHLTNLKQSGTTPASTYPVLLQGGASYSTVKGLHASGTNALIYCNAGNVNIDEITATNPTSTSIVAYFDSGATGVKVTNSRVQQTGSAVANQAPWYFAKPPALVDNIDYVGPYFGATAINFSGGLSGSYVGYVGNLPNPIQSQTLPQFTVANLPASTTVAKAYATNGLKPGESTGSGTGVEVIYTNSSWRRTCDYAVVSA